MMGTPSHDPMKRKTRLLTPDVKGSLKVFMTCFVWLHDLFLHE